MRSWRTGISGSAINESYLYSDTGMRVKKWSSSKVKYYSLRLSSGQVFNGQRSETKLRRAVAGSISTGGKRCDRMLP